MLTKFEIKANDAPQSIFKFLKKSYSSTPLSVIYKWLRIGAVKVNEKKIRDQKFVLKVGDVVVVYDPNQPVVRDQFKIVANPNLKIIYEDENLLIVNKPANLETHSPVNVALDDLVKSYLFTTNQYNPEKENSFVVSHVHRLDKLAQGLIIYAKNKVSLDILLSCFKEKTAVEKYYLARTSPRPWDKDFFSEGWIKYDQTQQKSIFSEQKQPGYQRASTAFKLLKKEKTANLIEVQLITGRKHQIRAVLSYYQMPILNDFRYQGQKVNQEKMIFLCAYKLIFQRIPAPLDYLNGQVFRLKLNNW